MPILKEPSHDAPLTQVDILKGLALFATEANWEEDGGSHYRVKSPLCMVISRPCAAIHRPQILVAEIEKIQAPLPKDLNTLEKVRRALEELRDGLGSPDRFYLGQEIPSFSVQGRFFARLDSMHTVKVPSSGKLAEFLRIHRTATLAEEFRRDLHRRIFSSVATLGFDDHGWYPSQDLEWVIAVGKKELSEIEAQISAKEAEMKKNVASGDSHKNEPLTRDIDKLSTKANEIRQELQLFEAEHRNRRYAGT